MTSPSFEQVKEWASETLSAEGEAIAEFQASRIDQSFFEAVRALLDCKGKVIVTGLGKSGHVGSKVASSLASTGTPAFFLHPAEALHGDFGMLQKGDCLLAIAYGGETLEVIEVAKYARDNGITVLSITGNLSSSLAKISHHILNGSVKKEADPHNLAPTCSSTLAMAIGDALTVSAMLARGFEAKDFAKLHPGGSLGRKLSTVSDHMIASSEVASINENDDFHTCLEAVTRFNHGITAVIDASGELVGAVSDGDLRRELLKSGAAALQSKARDFMSHSPKNMDFSELAVDAVRLMNEKKITQLFVLNPSQTPRYVGLVRLHDLLAAKIV